MPKPYSSPPVTRRDQCVHALLPLLWPMYFTGKPVTELATKQLFLDCYMMALAAEEIADLPEEQLRAVFSPPPPPPADPVTPPAEVLAFPKKEEAANV